ncbi:MAG: 4'-phosphopantetheinyl transferase superfamily protein [Methylovulum sp.]|nr:4'-phosphopantetheinyl transferase superfamily protein [Methylovulum sp.]
MALSLHKDYIHIWFAYPDEIKDGALLLNYADLLSDAEKERWQRFYFAQHRHQYLVTRALLRTTLSRYIDIDPKAWRFELNSYGKPEIATAQADLPIRFNVSHTDGLIMCGIVLAHDLGVDIENRHKDRASLNIAEHFFAKPEIADLNQVSEQQKQQRFFEYWTLKEAYIKARGMGLSLPLDQFSFTIAANQRVQIAFEPAMQDNPGHWQFWQLYPTQRHIAAVAVNVGSHNKFQLSINKVVPLQSSLPLPAVAMQVPFRY